MKVLIIDALSMLGENIVDFLQRETDWELYLLGSKCSPVNSGKEDLMYIEDKNKKDLKRLILDENPDVIINCIIAGKEFAENENREFTWEMNVNYNALFLSAAKISGAHYITFSSEMLFDGTKGPYSENDSINSISYFSKSLLAKENACIASQTNFTIFRLTELYGTSAYDNLDFVAKYLLLLSTGINLEIDSNTYSNPIYAQDVANCIAVAIERKKTGLYHLGGASYLNNYELFKSIAKIFNFDVSQIIEIKDKNIKKLGLTYLKAETDLRVKISSFENGLVALKYNSENFADMKIF